MNFNWRIPPQNFMDEVELRRFSEAMTLLKIESGTALDSYEMSPDGPILSSIYVFNVSYIVEINMVAKHLSFDASCVSKMINYRVIFGEHGIEPVIPNGSDPKTSIPISDSPKITKFVQLLVRHTDTLTTQLSYFGNDLDEWLKFAFDAYPKTNLLK